MRRFEVRPSSSSLRRWALGYAWLGLAALAGCGGGAGTPGPLDDAVVAPADWESHYAGEDLGGVVRGVVLEPLKLPPDPEMIPCSDAVVELWAPTPNGLHLDRRLAETRTDAQGRFEVAGAPRERFVLRVHKDRHVNTIGGYRVGVEGAVPFALHEPAELWLRPGRDVEGRLVDEAGKPLGGEAVWAASLAYLERVETDPDGGFRLRAPLGASEVFYDGQRRSPLRVGFNLEETGPPPTIELVRRDGGALRGQVRMGADGPPVAGATVMVLDRPEERTVSDAEGRFVLAASMGERVAAFSRGAGWRSSPVPPAGELELRVGPADRLTGKVTGPAGEPVEDARVMAVVPRFDGGLDRVWGPRTGPDGRFDFSWFPRPGRSNLGPAVVLAHRRGLGISRAVVIEGTTAPGDLSLQLLGEGSVVGRLQRHDGSVAQEARVLARWTDPGMPELYATYTGLWSDRDAWIEPDGSYRLDGIPHGFEAEIEATLRGYVSAVELAPEASWDRPQTADFQAPAGRTIRGRVANRAELPLPDGGLVFVTRLGSDDFEVDRTAPLEPDGSFVLEDIPDGRYQVTATVAGFEPGGTTAEAGESGVEILVERRSVVTIQAVFPVDADPAAATERVAVLSDGTMVRREPLDPGAGWAAVFDRVWAGKYELEVRAGVWQGRLRDVEVPDGERVTFEVPVTRTLRVDGVLVEAAGEPVPAMQLVANPRGIADARAQVVMTGPDGAFSVTGLRAGRWVLQAAPPGRARLLLPFDVPRDGSQPWRVVLPAHGSLSIRAPVDGTGGRGAIVALADSSGEPVPAWAPGAPSLAYRFRLPESGELSILGVPVGQVRVSVSGDGLAEPVTRTVEVTDGKSVDVDFR